MKPKLYLAAPMFSVAERRFNEDLAHILREWFDVFNPERDGHVLVDLIKNGTFPDSAARMCFEADLTAIRKSDVVLIVLDGRAVDEGAAFELGYAHGIKAWQLRTRPFVFIGVQMDPRRLLPPGVNNPMIQVPLDHLFHDIDSLISWAKTYAK